MRKFRKSVRKLRGSHTMGYGRISQHRKKGKRTGRGKTSQRWKAMRSYYLKQEMLGFPEPEWKRGKRGFWRPENIRRIYHINSINVKDLDLKIEKLVQEKKATKAGNAYNINLKEMNIQKIIGRGEVRKKLNISVEKASEGAIQKIEKAGGKVTLLTKAE